MPPEKNPIESEYEYEYEYEIQAQSDDAASRARGSALRKKNGAQMSHFKKS